MEFHGSPFRQFKCYIYKMLYLVIWPTGTSALRVFTICFFYNRRRTLDSTGRHSFTHLSMCNLYLEKQQKHSSPRVVRMCGALRTNVHRMCCHCSSSPSLLFPKKDNVLVYFRDTFTHCRYNYYYYLFSISFFFFFAVIVRSNGACLQYLYNVLYYTDRNFSYILSFNCPRLNTRWSDRKIKYKI